MSTLNNQLYQGASLKKLPTVYISIGGNIDPQRHIDSALERMQQDFSNMVQSTIFESKAVGFEGDNFLNLVVRFDSHMDVGELNEYLHALEDDEGRERVNGKAWDSRTLDLDILLYGDECGVIDGVELPRDEILDHAHVLLPLEELAKELIHPLTGKTYSQLLREVDFFGQEIWPVKP